MKLPVPDSIMQIILEQEDLPKYINKNQLAAALEVSPRTIDNWRSINSNNVPSPDLVVGPKKYWLPSVVAPFIEIYRRKNNKPIS